jgi:hypothetical protein
MLLAPLLSFRFDGFLPLFCRRGVGELPVVVPLLVPLVLPPSARVSILHVGLHGSPVVVPLAHFRETPFDPVEQAVVGAVVLLVSGSIAPTTAATTARGSSLQRSPIFLSGSRERQCRLLVVVPPTFCGSIVGTVPPQPVPPKYSSTKTPAIVPLRRHYWPVTSVSLHLLSYHYRLGGSTAPRAVVLLMCGLRAA